MFLCFFLIGLKDGFKLFKINEQLMFPYQIFDVKIHIAMELLNRATVNKHYKYLFEH